MKSTELLWEQFPCGRLVYLFGWSRGSQRIDGVFLARRKMSQWRQSFVLDYDVEKSSNANLPSSEIIQVGKFLWLTQELWTENRAWDILRKTISGLQVNQYQKKITVVMKAIVKPYIPCAFDRDDHYAGSDSSVLFFQRFDEFKKMRDKRLEVSRS